MIYDLLTLFLSSFISATLLPGGSEVLLLYFTSQSPEHSWFYFMTATLGNTLGSIVSYLMGYYFYWGRDKAQLKNQKAWALSQKYGVWALLLSWLPIIGDFFPLAAGWLKLPLWSSSLLIFIGKAVRYGVIVWLVI